MLIANMRRQHHVAPLAMEHRTMLPGPEATKSAAKNPSRACQADQAAIAAQPNALIRRSLNPLKSIVWLALRA